MLTTIKIIVLIKLKLKRSYLTDHHGNKQVNFADKIEPCARAFSRTLRVSYLQVFALSFDWFIRLSVCVRCDKPERLFWLHCN